MLQLEQLFHLTDFDDEDRFDPQEFPTEEAIERCRKPPEYEEDKEDWDIYDWRSCVENLVPRKVQPPTNAFQLPTSGVLTTSTAGYWSVCRSEWSFSLSDGVVLSKETCREASAERPKVRYQIGRANKSDTRALSIAMVLAEDFTSTRRYMSGFDIPKELEDPGCCRIRSWTYPHRSISDVPRTHWQVHGVLDAAVSGRLIPASDLSPEKMFLTDELVALKEATEWGCFSEAISETIEKLFGAMNGSAAPEPTLSQVKEGLKCTVEQSGTPTK